MARKFFEGRLVISPNLNEDTEQKLNNYIRTKKSNWVLKNRRFIDLKRNNYSNENKSEIIEINKILKDSGYYTSGKVSLYKEDIILTNGNLIISK